MHGRHVCNHAHSSVVGLSRGTHPSLPPPPKRLAVASRGGEEWLGVRYRRPTGSRSQRVDSAAPCWLIRIPCLRYVISVRKFINGRPKNRDHGSILLTRINRSSVREAIDFPSPFSPPPLSGDIGIWNLVEWRGFERFCFFWFLTLREGRGIGSVFSYVVKYLIWFFFFVFNVLLMVSSVMWCLKFIYLFLEDVS